MRGYLTVIILLFSVIFAHGTYYQLIRQPEIGIQIFFDSGAPIANSQALVFSPGSTKVHEKIQVDEQGRFFFTPDEPGLWSIQVRDRTGHGMRMNLTIDDNLQLETTKTSELNAPWRRWVTAVAIIWGFVGTALFFYRKNNRNASV